MRTVCETPLFLAQAGKLFSDEERKAIVDQIAFNPTAGDVIPGTGGVRKMRVGASGRGKRGGARVIYYYLDDDTPLFALLVYAKNVATDLTPDGRKLVAALAASIKSEYRRSRE